MLIDLRVTELLAARLCHELVSPVGAINNGVELLTDDPEFAAEAAALIAQSGGEAARRLQFYRIAYGATAAVASGLARAAARDLFAHGKVACDWPESIDAGADAKLVCNLLLVAAETLPRGGTVAVEASLGRGAPCIRATGEALRLPGHLGDALDGKLGPDEVDARSVQAYYTGRLAARARYAVTVQTTGETCRLSLRDATV